MASYFLKELFKALQLRKESPMPATSWDSHARVDKLSAFANSTQGVKILQFDRNKYGR